MKIKNCRYLDWQDLSFTDCDLEIQQGAGGKISILDSGKTAGKRGSTAIDAENRIVTKAFGCGHHHIYSALARGMPAPKNQPGNFLEILKNIWWVLDSSLDEEMIRASAQSTALDLVKNGSSLVIDHHASPSCVHGSLEMIHEELDKIGLNHILCYEMSDRDGPELASAGLTESKRYLKSGKPGLVGLHASFTVDEELLDAALDLARDFDSGIHIHAAEDMYDSYHCRKRYHKKLMQRLEQIIGFEKSILVHCLHLDDEERELLSGSKAWAAQNPDSNINNNVGFLRTEGIEERLMLGTDGMHSDMLKSLQQAWFIGNTLEVVSGDDAYSRFRNVHRYVSQSFPGLEGENSLVILDYDSPTPVTEENFLGHLFYGLDSSNVWSTIINGRLVYHKKEFTEVDENEIHARCREQAKRLWKQMDETGVHP